MAEEVMTREVIDILNMSAMDQLSWKNLRTPAKFSVVAFLIILVLWTGMQLMTSNRLGRRQAVRMRSWLRFFCSLALVVLIFIANLIAVNTLHLTGWTVLAWIMALVPVVWYVSSMFAMDTVSNIVDYSNPGNDIARMLREFYNIMPGPVGPRCR